MDRSRRQGAKEADVAPPPASRLTLKPRRNRRRSAPPGSLWSRVPRPAQIADACGRALRRSLPAIVGGAILAAIGGTAWAGYHFVTTSSRFTITEIAVHGNQHLTVDQVRAALPVHAGDNAFTADLAATTRALHEQPWIAHAEAHRILPHTIAIDVREYQAAAIVDLGERYLVDDSGHPFKRNTPDDPTGLPKILGLDRAAYLADPEATAARVRGAIDVLDAWRAVATRPEIAEIALDDRGRVVLRTDTLAIELGLLDAGLPARLQTFDAAWASLDESERARATTLHLDARPDHATVAFKDP